MSRGGRPRRLHELARAVGLGVLLFVGVAALGEAIGFAVFLARGGAGTIGEHAGLGWLYVLVFHGVPVDIAPADARIVTATRVTFALLLPTLLIVWLAFVAGRAVAREAVGPAPWRIVVALVVAVPYAAASFVLSNLVSVRLDLVVTDNLFGGPVTLMPDPSETLLRTFAAVAIPAVVGALAAVRRPDLRAVHRVYAVVAGGARMFALALLLAFVGLLVNAGADPDAARAYLSAVAEPSPAGTATIVGHHVLALPNQSVWVLVPAMGGSDELRVNATDQTIVSYGATIAEIGVAAPNGTATPPIVSTEPLPRWYLLFLLVPALATFLGGSRAAQVARSLAGALALGAAAGVVFAGLVALGSALSEIAYRANLAGGEALTVAAGPDLRSGLVVALAWGVAGGAIGGWRRWIRA